MEMSAVLKISADIFNSEYIYKSQAVIFVNNGIFFDCIDY